MYVHLPSTKQDVVPLYEEHPQDGFLKVIFRKLLWKIFPPIDVEVYSKKLESWVTMKIPEGLDSLIPMQLAALEARTKLPQFSGIDERNQFLRSYKVHAHPLCLISNVLIDESDPGRAMYWIRSNCGNDTCSQKRL